MVNEVVLAKLQGFLLGMLIIVFNNNPPHTLLKACGRIYLQEKIIHV